MLSPIQSNNGNIAQLLPHVFVPTPAQPCMIVFDKDGTLGDARVGLRHWAHTMSDHLCQACGDNEILEPFHQLIGWDASQNDVTPSALLASGTWDEIIQDVYSFIDGYQSSSSSSTGGDEKVSFQDVQEWHDQLGELLAEDPPLVENLRGLILQCKALGYIIAVCTSDDRGPTDASLKFWKIDDLVDYSVCGNEVSQGKPSAAPLNFLCEKAGVLPQHCIVVGDTTADTGMARNAQAGFCVGVLTGSGTAEQLLEHGAQLILPDIGHIPELLKSVKQHNSSETDVPGLMPDDELPKSQKVAAS